jgi:hypothetical protein
VKTNGATPLPAALARASVRQCHADEAREIAITVLDLCGREPAERHRFYELLADVLASIAQADSGQKAA